MVVVKKKIRDWDGDDDDGYEGEEKNYRAHFTGTVRPGDGDEDARVPACARTLLHAALLRWWPLAASRCAGSGFQQSITAAAAPGGAPGGPSTMSSSSRGGTRSITRLRRPETSSSSSWSCRDTVG